MYSLIDFIPQSIASQLNSFADKIRFFQLIKFLCQSGQEALEKFNEKKYEYFDAQVSENLCQIRAYQLICLLKNSCDLHDQLKILNAKFIEVQSICEIALEELCLLKHRRDHKNVTTLSKIVILEKLFDYYEIKILFSEEIYFIILNYILSVYKQVGEYNISYGIDYDKVCIKLNIHSKTFAKKIIHHFQRIVSKKSCQFIFNILGDLNNNLYDHYLLKSLYFNDEIGRHVMSCYEVMKVILKHSLKNLHSIAVKVIRESDTQSEKDEVVFILQPSPCKNYYRLVPENDHNSDALMLFIGVTRYSHHLECKHVFIERFMRIGFQDIILANMAQHPQYAGLLLDDKKYNPYSKLNAHSLPSSFNELLKDAEERFLKHKLMSDQIGCHRDDPSLFLLTHIHSYHISSILSNYQK